MAVPLQSLVRSLCLLALAISSIPAFAYATLDPYTADDRKARQDLELPGCAQDFNIGLIYDGLWTNEFTTDAQAVALNCELEMWHRDPDRVDPADVAQREADINAHLRRLMDRIVRGNEQPPCASTSPQNPEDCFTNTVIARKAGHMVAYILNRYTERTWEQATFDQALVLFSHHRWPDVEFENPGNSYMPIIGMRLMGGEAIGNEPLRTRGVAELHHVYAREIRQGVPEPMARHYAGVTIGQLELLREINDGDSRAMIENLLAMQLLVNAHNYMPGGDVGNPLNRKSSPLAFLEVAGNNPELLNHINMVVNDPGLDPAIGYDPRTLSSDYTAPEVIRSIFLHKGQGYRFWHRGLASDHSRNGLGFEGERYYPSPGWQGMDGHEPTAHNASPWQTAMLPNGTAQLGIMYASGGNDDYSSGLTARDGSTTFSTYYHHQPRANPLTEPSWDPLVDDPSWRYEAKGSYRRMMYGHTVITLFDPHYFVPEPGELLLPYTIAHIPGEVGASIAECPSPAYAGGNRWLVQEHSGAYVAFLPLGPHTRETKDGGAWTFLRFDDDAISGNVTEIASSSEFADTTAYCNDLATRSVQFDPTTIAAQLEVSHPSGPPATIRLVHANDERSIDFGSGFVVQPDVGYIDRGILHVEPTSEPSWLSWLSEFHLRVQRDVHPVLEVDFGDPTQPTPPQTLEVKDEEPVNNTPFQLSWDHGLDDTQIVEYRIWRNGVWVDSVFYDDPSDPFGAADGRKARFTALREPNNGGLPEVVSYRVDSVDGNGKVSPVKSMIKEVNVQALPPSPATLTSAVGGLKNVALDWTAATDNWGIYTHQVFRDGDFIANVGGTAEAYVDTSVLPNRAYNYTIRAYDKAGLPADSAPVQATTPPDTALPSAPKNVQGNAWASNAGIWWEKASDDWGIYAYQVSRNGVWLSGTNQLYHIDNGLAPGTYVYKVRAIDWGANVGPESAEILLEVVP